MGDWLASTTGNTAQYSAQNPYSSDVLQQSANQTQQQYQNQNGLGGSLQGLGLGQQTTAAAQQAQLGQALQNQANGGGPNPAQSMTQQAMQQNSNQANALAQSQRGVNPALAQRNAQMAASQSNQAIAGQGQTLAAQQQLAAQSQLAGLTGQEASQGLGATGQAGNLYGTAGQQQLGQQSLYTGANAATQNINAGLAQGNQSVGYNMFSGLVGNAGAGAMMLARGGMVPGYADGGAVGVKGANLSLPGLPSQFGGNAQSNQAGSAAGKYLNGLMTPGAGSQAYGAAGAAGGGAGAAAGPMAGGTALLAAAAKGGSVGGKAKVSGDSSKNDTVPAMLSPGEIVIPRSIVQSESPEKDAANFVAKELSKRGSPSQHDDFKEALKRAVKERKSK
jgi:hypothetical protein